MNIAYMKAYIFWVQLQKMKVWDAPVYLILLVVKWMWTDFKQEVEAL